MKVNKLIDHTILKAFATEEEVLKLCKEAVEYDFKSVCVNPVNVALAKKALEGLNSLKGAEAHSTVILSQVDETLFKKLGINLTCEAVYGK